MVVRTGAKRWLKERLMKIFEQWRKKRATQEHLKQLGYDPCKYESMRDTGSYYILHDKETGRTLVVDKKTGKES